MQQARIFTNCLAEEDTVICKCTSRTCPPTCQHPAQDKQLHARQLTHLQMGVHEEELLWLEERVKMISDSSGSENTNYGA